MDRPLIGTALIVRKGNQFLLHKRKGPHAKGTWGCPGGHLEMWETFEESSLRELHEEAGPLAVSLPRFFTAANTRFYEEGRHYVTIFMVCDWIAGEPQIMEPDKCDGWAWFTYDNLPHPLMMGIDIVKHQGLLRQALEDK